MTSKPFKLVHYTSSYKRQKHKNMRALASFSFPYSFANSFPLFPASFSPIPFFIGPFPFFPLHISPSANSRIQNISPFIFPQPLQKMPSPLCSSKGMLFLPILATFLLGNVPKTVWAQLLGGISQQRSSSIFERVKPEPSCRPLNIPLCREIPYNRTIFPNPFVELDWPSLQSQTEHFKPLIRTRCSPHILFFVCSTFAPMCPEQMPQAVTSCRSVCEEVQRDCIKIFHEFDFPWPPLFNCSRFPSPPALCMQPEPMPPNADGNGLSPSPKMPECPPDLVDLDPNYAAAKCAFRCDKTTMFRKDRKDQARLWLSCWALLNAGVSLFTVCSFWIDKTRFGFPERSVCFLALCSLLSSLPHLLGRLLGFEQIACAKLASGAKFLILDGPHENSACMATFLLHYYFSLAGALWWLLLGFTWYLSASRKWVEEEIGKRSILLHILAWTLPAGMAAGGLFGANRVDASELTGICSIGNSDPESLLWFWLLPRFVLIILGLLLLLAGFSAMCKERNSFRRRGTDTSRLEKFLLKMGSFAAIYVLSSLVACFADFHHFSVLTQWEPNTVGCKARGGTFSGRCIRPEQPEPEIYVLGQTLAIAGGLATGLWIFSPKTLISWRRALFCCWPAQPKRPPITLGMMGGGIASSPALHPSSVHNSRPGSIPPSQRPLLAASLPPTDLPPPPPTAVPSSTYATQQHPFLPAPQYIPLSILTGAQGGSSTTRSGGPNLGGGILEHNLFHGC